MNELIAKYLSNGLADFEGLEVNGSVPVKQEVINEFITAFLQSAAGETTEPAPAAPPETKPKSGNAAPAKSGGLPIKALLGMVKRAEVQLVEGKLIAHFTIKR